MGGLGILADPRIVVRRSRRAHGAQPASLDALREQARPDEPVGLGRGLLGVELFHQRPEHIGHALVERAGLAAVVEIGFVLCHAVRQLVADHVQRAREALEDHAVAVAEHHLASVPERVAELGAVMDRRLQAHAAAVDRVAPVHVPVELVGGAQTVIGFVHGRVRHGGIALGANDRAGQPVPMMPIVDRAPLDAGRRDGQRRDAADGFARAAQPLRHQQRLERRLGQRSQLGIGLLRQMHQQMRRNDATAAHGAHWDAAGASATAPPRVSECGGRGVYLTIAIRVTSDLPEAVVRTKYTPAIMSLPP